MSAEKRRSSVRKKAFGAWEVITATGVAYYLDDWDSAMWLANYSAKAVQAGEEIAEQHARQREAAARAHAARAWWRRVLIP